jgi:hypothetical protein
MGLQEVIEQQHERSRQHFAGQVSKCTGLVLMPHGMWEGIKSVTPYMLSGACALSNA